MNKEKLKKDISDYIQANILRHYEYLSKSVIPMDKFNREFIPVLLKEINKDIQGIIDANYRKKKD